MKEGRRRKRTRENNKTTKREGRVQVRGNNQHSETEALGVGEEAKRKEKPRWELNNFHPRNW